ncbi:nucleobase-ascorbate transporter 6-like [Impatiens glandulifera]|uniref:nucleobase-ascorbate transporter 6-like n=1 Tax=Impatiens glandulifera TaxID=253017 RepID=UPI001FB07402|nr:nucleobase-ascorbate transporter 6-like [Impatiens glandulifera]
MVYIFVSGLFIFCPIEIAHFGECEENCKCGCNAPKFEEIKPFPILDQLPGVHYCINSSPPLMIAIALGFQHFLVALGTTIFIPTIFVNQVGGSNFQKVKLIQTFMFVSGVSTLLQSSFGTRLPSVMRGSYSFLIPMASIIHSKRFESCSNPEKRFESAMRDVQGALIISSCFQLVIGFLGLWRIVVRLLSPLSMVPIVTFTGLGLYSLGFPLLIKCAEVGLPELALVVLISQYLPYYLKKAGRVCDLYAIVFSIAFAWIYAIILTSSGAYKNSNSETRSSCSSDHSRLVSAAPWIYIPYPCQWGNPTFNAGSVVSMTVAALVASVESTGVFLVTARFGSATLAPASVLSRGTGWMGVGTMMAGLFGCPTGCSASAENAGFLAMTKVGSRRVVQISAVFMIFFSIVGKFGAIFASIPLPIFAALFCIFFGYVSSGGLGFLQFCNLNSFRTKMILGLSFFLGLSIPQYFREHEIASGHGSIQTRARWFNDMLTVIFTSHVTVSAVIAILLDRTLPRENDDGRRDNGLQMWERFVKYNTDPRTDEFYRLPFNLNSFFPPV